jgi:glycosyltransferase involved in cell wall biosynthesis
MEKGFVEGPLRVLQICSKPPLPHGDGGAMAMHNLSQLLLSVPCALRICTLSTHKHPFSPSAYSEEWNQKTQISAFSLDSRPSLSALFKSIITGRSFFFSRFQHRKWRRFIEQAILENRPEIVILDGLYSAGCLEVLEKHNVRIWLRAHNIEWMLWDSVAQTETHLVKRFLYRRWMRTLRIVERNIWTRVNRVLAITPEDAQIVKHSVENTVPVSILPATAPKVATLMQKLERVPLHAYHLGGLGWLPNRQGICWFMEKVWPEVLKVAPRVELHLGGEAVSDLVSIFPTNVCVHGLVKDLPGFLQSVDVLVLPYKSGGGLRIKAVEALAYGKVVIGTKMGLAGIPKMGECVLEANSPEDFARAFSRMAQWTPEHRAEQSKNAQALAESAFGFANNLEKLNRILQDESGRS